MDLVELFERGGPLMWPILFCSVVAAAAFVDRLFALRRSRIAPAGQFESLARHLDAGDTERAEQLCRENQSILARVTHAGLLKRRAGRAVVKEAMEEAGAIDVGKLESWVAVLSTVAAITPLLGLLGTVGGMIEVFVDIEGTTEPDIQLLAGGIWKALITTGAGLTVAIPVFIAYRTIEARIDRIARELEAKTLSLLDLMTPTSAATPDDGGPAPAEAEDGAAA